jgi:ABC-type Zn uptake system ZnuABC Zn-binding protein ZnuA
MRTRPLVLFTAVATTVIAAAAWVGRAWPDPSPSGPLRVAATEADIGAIVAAVGGEDVATFHLFQGCILRPNLEVRAEVTQQLATAEAIVWTGFFNESRAIQTWLEALPEDRRSRLEPPTWIDVSLGVQRVNVPVSECDGYLELQYMPGDAFFWLNPENGTVIARNVAEGLSQLRPARRGVYEANAEAFIRDLERRISEWKTELAPLTGLKVFSAQCGWQNLSRLGGPHFMACRKNPGQLRPPEELAAQLAPMGLDVIIVDPNTPAGYAEAFRATTTAEVVVIPSSIADIPGARTYPALFDTIVDTLLGTAAGKRAAAAGGTR